MNKTTLIVIGAVILLGGGYFIMTGTPKSDSAIEQIDPSTNGELVGTRATAILNQVRRLEIDTKLFEDRAFMSLDDHVVVIPTLNVSRPNPFAPIPGFTPVVPKK